MIYLHSSPALLTKSCQSLPMRFGFSHLCFPCWACFRVKRLSCELIPIRVLKSIYGCWSKSEMLRCLPDLCFPKNWKQAKKINPWVYGSSGHRSRKAWVRIQQVELRYLTLVHGNCPKCVRKFLHSHKVPCYKKKLCSSLFQKLRETVLWKKKQSRLTSLDDWIWGTSKGFQKEIFHMSPYSARSYSSLCQSHDLRWLRPQTEVDTKNTLEHKTVTRFRVTILLNQICTMSESPGWSGLYQFHGVLSQRLSL